MKGGPAQLPLPRDYPATVVEIVQAQADAQRAACTGGSVEGCPYRGATDDKGRFLARIWARAFRTETVRQAGEI